MSFLKLGIRINKAVVPGNNSLGKTTSDWDAMEKSFKYLRRWMGRNGKWQYLYAKDILRPVNALKRLFGYEDKKLSADYEKNNIKKQYGADKKTFAGHVLEYLSNRFKWDNLFKQKESREKYNKPVKQKDVSAAVESLNNDGQAGLFKEKKKQANIINRSLMKKVWEIYNPQKAQETEKEKISELSEDLQDLQNEYIGASRDRDSRSTGYLSRIMTDIENTAQQIKDTGGKVELSDDFKYIMKDGGLINRLEGGANGKDQSGIGQEELPAGTSAVRAGGGESAGGSDVHRAEQAGNAGESGGASDESGGIPGRDFRGKRGRSAIKDIREQVKKLLDEKTDGEMTEADKQLLRQYEGSGGLGEKDATTHGTLYEYYTPQKVVDKVWQLVDKYNPRTDKTVIEPSAGTGRFAENRTEKFAMFELDQTSARIAGILHPDAKITQGYFQEQFMNGRTPVKKYAGDTYDVAIGNPPYGKYSGKYAGLGEGKIHTKIDEYFIDRSLDTLKDGGILAMVVPSSFLRGRNSLAKMQIAKKAKLLESWRLPNGTFGTTGIGTDIIVLRKEPGDVMDYSNDIYFQAHKDQIAGIEAEKLGRFGMEKYVSPPDGMTFDEALDSINPAYIANVIQGEKSITEAAMDDVEVSEAEEHQNRSRAMEGNKNAYKGGPEEDDSELSEDPESEKRTPEDYKLHYVDMGGGKRVFNKKKYIHVGTEGYTNESVAYIEKDGSVNFFFENTPEKVKNEIMEEAKRLYGRTKLNKEENGVFKKRISGWLSPGNLSEARGKTREEIFSQFGNEYEPIASISPEYTNYLGMGITDTNVYCGKGYLIDHSVHNHPEVDVSEYAKIPDILSNPDDVKLDDRNKERNSLVFIKKYDRYGTVVISVDKSDTGQIVIHKTFFYKTKNPYAQLKSIRASSPDTAHLSISHTDESAPAGKRISALDDSPSSIPQSGEMSSQSRSEAMRGNDNAAGSRGGEKDEPKGRKKQSNTDDYVRSIGKNMSANEFNEQYGILIDKKDLPIFAATDYDGRIEVGKLSKKDREHLHNSGNFTVDSNGTWYSIANYASGNIYDKLDQLERDKEKIISTTGEKTYEFNKALLEAAKLPPKVAENIHFSPISDFAKEYKIVLEGDEGGIEIDLRQAFKKWAGVVSRGWGRKTFDSWDEDESPISQYEIPSVISFNDVLAYINQEPQKTDRATKRDADNDTAKMEAARKREARRECAERLFNRFIREGLPEDQRKALVEAWNRRYNSVVNPDYRRIPVFVEGMNTHKGEKEFALLDEQVGEISFLCNKGNGISAAEVGVGKTVIGESVAVHTINAGRAKKVFNTVPKSVYKKWIKEYHQHFPDAVICELGNFSDKNLAPYKNADGTLNIPEGSVSVCTFEALQKITFKDETIDNDLIDDMMDSQTIYDKEAQEKRTFKELAEEREKMMERLGKGAKSKEGAVFWEDTGFDAVIVDEIHNFKNVFGQTRSFSASVKDTEGKERQSNEFKGLTGGESDRAMKLFAVAQLVQKQNDGRNVFGLSATPFTNSPIETYNILSLVARNKLKELHIYNMYEFLAQFAEVKSEWSVSAKGEIVEKEVMKNWKNLGALQNLITEYISRVEADKAGVIRPRKKLHLPQIELTPLQKAIIKAETDYMTNADPKKDPGATLKAINYMRMAALSPAAVNQERWEFYNSEYAELFKGLKIPSSKEFVKSSPKMKFVCDSVSKAYKKMPDAGQIIYLPRGVNDYVHVKKYLMDQGMPEDSIAFMHSKTSLDEKERIKAEFNDKNGKIKVIIGSETIKEGVSLNGNTHSIYNCMLGWNPTETTQVEGRAWRQGNAQGHVHVVYPLMADSIDSLMYQKYDEKSSRINEIWSYKGDTSNEVSDIDPESLKFDLIKDPEKKAGFVVGQRRDKVRADMRIEEARYEVLFKDRRLYENAEKNLPAYKRRTDAAETEMLKFRKKRDEAQKELDKAKKSGNNEAHTKAARDLNGVKWSYEQATSNYRSQKKAYKEVSDRLEALETKFEKMDLKPNKIEARLKEISSNIEKLKKEEDAIDKSYSVELEKAKKELKKKEKKLPPVAEQVEDNVREIMGNLRPMKEVKYEIKKERLAGLEDAIQMYEKTGGNDSELTVLKRKRQSLQGEIKEMVAEMKKEGLKKSFPAHGKKSFVISNGRLLLKAL